MGSRCGAIRREVGEHPGSVCATLRECAEMRLLGLTLEADTVPE